MTQTSTDIQLPEGFEYLKDQTCPETGLVVQRYESSCLDRDWSPRMPEGWEVFDDEYEGKDEYQKWHESTRRRRIGPARMVWALAAAAAGATFTPAEVN